MQTTLSQPETTPGQKKRRRSPLWAAMRRFPVMDPAPGEPKLAHRAAFLMLLVGAAVLGVMASLVMVFTVAIPQMAELERYRPDTTTELYDIHGKIFGSFALERRIVVPYSEFPPVLRQAIFSIEDKNFETNGGVNFVRVIGAAYADLHSDKRAQGASTITMQLTRNLFLSTEKTFGRKLQEIFLALQIERHFTKQQIFTLYANQIYLGRGTYGFEAGSEYYFSKHARDLTLPEAALLAALPKGPEEFSPVRHPDRALKRRNLVLQEMLQDRKITQQQAATAEASPLGLHLERPANTEAPYFVEEVRRQLEREYGVDEVHGAGLRVYTTLDLDLQRAAEKALLDNVATYERRRGWKGNLENVLREGADLASYKHPDWAQPVVDGSVLPCAGDGGFTDEDDGAHRQPERNDDLPGLGLDNRDARNRSREGRRHRLREGDERRSLRSAASHPRAGQRSAGVADGDRQRERRSAGDGRRPRLRALAVQPRDAGRTAGRFVLQDLRLHRGDGSRHEAV